MPTKRGSAEWKGEIRTGEGTVSTETGALKAHPYGFRSRFEDGPGTNPEELIGAAHAACFSMAFSGMLGQAGISDVTIATDAAVTIEKQGDGFAITRSALTCRVRGTGDEAAIRQAAENAKAGCPVSKVLNCDISLDLTVG